MALAFLAVFVVAFVLRFTVSLSAAIAKRQAAAINAPFIVIPCGTTLQGGFAMLVLAIALLSARQRRAP